MWSMVAAAIRYGVCLRNTQETRNDLGNSIHAEVTKGKVKTDSMSNTKEELDSCWKTPVDSGGTQSTIPVIKLHSPESTSSKLSQNVNQSEGRTATGTSKESRTATGTSREGRAATGTSREGRTATGTSGEGMSSQTTGCSRENGLTQSTDNSVNVPGSVCRLRGSGTHKEKHKVKVEEKKNGAQEKKQEEDKFLSAKSSNGRDRSGSDKRRDKRRHRDKDRSRQSAQPVKNTEEGHLIFKKCDVLHERYQIKRELGEGTFGKVVLCKDKQKNDKRVAVKVIRNVEKYRDAAQIEIEILEKIRKAGGCEGSVEMLASFNHHGHMCIVFEVLGKSVFDFLKDNGFTPFPLAHIQRMADDVLAALSFLHGMKYTHTDLKPENILFIDSDYESVYDKRAGMTVRNVISPRVKLIDFGSATHEDEHHSRIVSTRHYRAPEVIAEIGWSYPCDMWSVGCILFEIYTGHTMFQTHDNSEHLAMMEHILGTIPPSICQRSKKRYFKDDRLDFNKSGSSGRYIRKYCKKLDNYQREDTSAHDTFFDLLKGLLNYTASDRFTAEQSLQHPFFDRRLSDRDRSSRSYKSR